jgi:protein-arginine kinase
MKTGDSISLQQSLIKEVASLFDNEDAMKKMLSLAKKLKREKHEAEKEELSKAEKQEVLDDLREAFKELKDVKEGKVELQSARDFLYEVRDKGR